MFSSNPLSKGEGKHRNDTFALTGSIALGNRVSAVHYGLKWMMTNVEGVKVSKLVTPRSPLLVIRASNVLWYHGPPSLYRQLKFTLREFNN